jgi:alpha-glucuronidase
MPIYFRKTSLSPLSTVFALMLTLLVAVGAARAEDGYRLWLRYDPLPSSAKSTYQKRIAAVSAPDDSAAQVAAREELIQGCSGLLGRSVPDVSSTEHDGAVIIGTPKSSAVIKALKWDRQLDTLGTEGFVIRSVKNGSRSVTVIASATDTGVLYGTFHFLRLLQTLHPIDKLNITEKPRLKLRVLNHWDNLNGSIERGYAGRSLWNWDELPDTVDSRLRDYARANASLGINGSVLNNVNSNAKSLTPEYLRKTAAIAEVFRPYGIRVYLSVRFSAPIELGGLKTADPLDPNVAQWWKTKADEIYRLIPDFGGFLVKANSEGQPGPLTYKRTHADGANMLAAAVAPHGGVVMWRAFVYAAKPGSDRVAQSYDALKPFDGKFASNVLLQVKNGPLDFQPREPFHPLYGAMPKTQIMPELQITQEYLGHANQIVFLAPMWRECLDSDTYAKGRGSTVEKIMDGTLYGQHLTGIAGVANTGSDRNWTGHDFAQANWYAFGRLAWNPHISSERIVGEWTQMTFTHNQQTAKVISRILLGSHEAAVDYMTPLGLTHQTAINHYGPAPWDNRGHGDTAPIYFNRADTVGIGFDRTRNGSNAVSQYQPDAQKGFADLSRCPDKYLLWFHHVAWDYRMRSGQTLWDALCSHYQSGVNWVRSSRKDWNSLSGAIDSERHAAVLLKLALQERDATYWRDASLLYFQTFSQRPLPAGVEKPQQTLEEIKAHPLPENSRR